MTGSNYDTDLEGRAAEVRASFARQGLMTLIGAQITALGAGTATIELAFSEAVSQQQGFFHGSVIGAIADSAGGYAAMMALPAGTEVVSLEYKINFLRPASGARLIARAQVLRAGRTIAVSRVDVAASDHDGSDGGLVRERLCAAVQQSVSVSRAAVA